MADQVTVNIGGDTRGLQQALNQGSQAIDQFAQRTQTSIGSPELRGQVGQLNQAFGLLGVNLGGALQGFLALDPEIAAIAIPVGLLFKGVTELGGGVLDLGQKLVEIPFDLFQQGVEDSIRLVEQLTDRLAQLAEQGVQQAFSVTEMSEKNLVNLSFLWGGIDTTPGTPGYGTGPGFGPATQLMQWSKQASLYMPWTRQDLMQAMVVASINGGTPVGTVEHDLGVLSDVASAQGRPNVNLQWAAMAAMRGSQGYGRMLLMELGLSKEKLAPFGYDETDDSTLYPALEAYAKSKGELGGSKFIAENTFWGAQTSAVDRLQNFGLSLMGWNDNPKDATDDVVKGSPFWWIKKDLKDLTDWFDAHQAELQQWGGLISRALGGGLQLATNTLGGLGDALHKSGLDTFLKDSLKNFGDFLNDPKTQQAFTQIGEVVGGVLGPGLQDMGAGIQSFMTALANSGLGQELLHDLQQFGAWLQSPDGKAAFQEFGQIMGNVVGGGLKMAYDAAKGFITGLADSGLGQAILNTLNQMGLWLTDPKNQEQVQAMAQAIGETLGVSIQLVAAQVWDLAQNFGVLFDQIRTGAQVAMDTLKAMGDLMSGNIEAYTADLAKLGIDTAAFDKAMQEQPNLTPPWMIPAGGGGTAPGAHTGPHAPAGHHLTDAGAGDAATYLSAFTTTMNTQAPKTMSTAVQAYTTGMQAQLKTSGSTLARDLADYIATAVQQGIADALRTMRITGNGDLRQPGAYRSGGIGIGGAL